eukprot:CAMPEP_0172599460 /NCGR_PEP_ID=MMETSP1068-20121228/19546_1 /TAXON_ID=35684 /ORGANISM="Pseudopedinella elastica, Strain CCMP716" /LENGTH=530 /DNA_ID=CAMNT_0013399715 /DNA_START=398 /DNA_END=1991 /DNA_ORIENTATION=+
MVYFRETWDPCANCGRALYLVAIEAAAEDALWRSGGTPELFLTPPDDTPFKDMFDSYSWVVALRIVLPIICLWTATDAGLEVHRIMSSQDTERRRTSHGAVALIVCSVETFALGVSGIFLALGHYGVYTLPIQVHSAVYTLLTGASLFTTFLVGLHLREENRILFDYERGLQDRRPILKKYKSLLIGVSIAALVLDLVCVPMLWYFYVLLHARWLYFIAVIGYSVFQFVASIFFIFSAWTLIVPLRFYLNTSLAASRDLSSSSSLEEQRSSPAQQKIGRLIFWLGASAGAMLLTCVGLLYSLVPFRRARQESIGHIEYAATILVVVVPRIFVSYFQVQAMTASESSVRATLCAFLVAVLRCCDLAVKATRGCLPGRRVGTILPSQIPRIDQLSDDQQNQVPALPAVAGPAASKVGAAEHARVSLDWSTQIADQNHSRGLENGEAEKQVDMPGADEQKVEMSPGPFFSEYYDLLKVAGAPSSQGGQVHTFLLKLAFEKSYREFGISLGIPLASRVRIRGIPNSSEREQPVP